MSLAAIPVGNGSPAQVAADRRSKPRRQWDAQRIFRTLHLILGLSFGVVLVVQGLSGSALVWRPELDRLMLPSLTHDTTAAAGTPSLDRELAAVRLASPQGKVRAVRLALTSRGTDEWMVQMPSASGQAVSGAPSQAARPVSGEGAGPRWTVYTSPGSGQVIGVRGARRDALQFLIELHHNLLFGKTGRAIQGYLAIATILLALSGLWLWWPAAWTPSRFRPRAAARPLHYAIGFWAMWPLLLIATTATYFVWRQPIDKAFGAAAPQSPSAGADRGHAQEGSGHGDPGRKAHTHDGAPDSPRDPSLDSSRDSSPKPARGASLDAVMAAARAAQPTARFTMIRFPEGRGSNDYAIMFESAAEHYRAAPNSLTVHAGNGSLAVTKVSFWKDQPRINRLLGWLPRIHQAEICGLFNPLVRCLWCATGLMPAVLFVSGFLMWRRRLAVEK